MNCWQNIPFFPAAAIMTLISALLTGAFFLLIRKVVVDQAGFTDKA
jgi:uncharacterized membrane protein (DUF106 family)